MELGDFKDRLQDLGQEHGDKIEQGLDEAADVLRSPRVTRVNVEFVGRPRKSQQS